jgi:DNA-binding Lrp family transcriptional regulator
MKLTEIQRKILHAVILQANAPEADIARSLKIRAHTVRRTIQMFLESGIFVRRSVFIDPGALGLSQQVILLSLPLGTLREKKKLIDILVAADEVSAVYELTGEAQVEIRLCTRGPASLNAFLGKLAKEFSESLFVRSIHTITEYEYSGVGNTTSSGKHNPSLRYELPSSQRSTHELSERDHAILSALSNEKYLSLRQVARTLSLPSSTLSFRVSALEEAGVIKGHYYIVDVKKFSELPILLKINSRLLRLEERAAFRRFCQVHPQIAWVAFLAGGHSAEVLVRVQGNDEALGVVDDLSRHFSGIIQTVDMSQLLHFHKFTPYPFRRFAALAGS